MQGGSAGYAHACVVLATGQVQCVGGNDSGELGDGSTAERSLYAATSTRLTAVEVSAGDQFACALRTDEGIRCWGRNDYGQLGDGTMIHSPTPRPVCEGDEVAIGDTCRELGPGRVAMGSNYTCAASSRGEVYCGVITELFFPSLGLLHGPGYLFEVSTMRYE